MCLILISYRQDPDYPLILIANRDEFFSRPTRAAQYWEDYPFILAGRDLEQGGTWMGITKQGKFAAVTNFREPPLKKTGKTSRGLLVSDYLTGRESPLDYLSGITKRLDQYDAFNLIVGDSTELYFLGSRKGDVEKLTQGIYGISNGELDCPWPKVKKGKARLSNEIANNNELDPERLMRILAETGIADDSELPDTGIGIELERKLSPAFINLDGYGTRSSTVLLIDRQNRVQFKERGFNENAEVTNNTEFEFLIE